MSTIADMEISPGNPSPKCVVDISLARPCQSSNLPRWRVCFLRLWRPRGILIACLLVSAHLTILHDTLFQVENKEDLDKEQWWRVILHNDEIHTFDYVTQSITKASVILLLLLRAVGGNSLLGMGTVFNISLAF